MAVGLLAALLLVGAVVPVPALDRALARLPPLARRLAAPALLAALGALLLAPLCAGRMPMSHDHPVHLFKAWHFWDKLLAHGALRGWSSYWFAGYPAEELYPIGPDLFLAAVRALTLGRLSWEATYAVGFLVVFVSGGLAVYHFGARRLGPVAGLVAGALWLVDRGDYREGGWSYTVHWAVWPQVLATAALLVALARLPELVARPRPRALALSGGALGFAILCHPMTTVVLAAALPAALVARRLAPAARAAAPLGAALARGGAALGLGLGLSAFWYLPMTARAAWTASYGELWRPLGWVGRAALRGGPFAHVPPPIFFAAAAGGLVGLVRRRAPETFLLALAVALVVGATSSVVTPLLDLSDSLARIQYQRFLIPAKACLFLLAGAAVQQALGAARRALAGRGAATRGAAAAALVAAGLALGPPAAAAAPRYYAGVGRPLVAESFAGFADLRRLLEWSTAERRRLPGFYRIAYALDPHDHLFMGAPVTDDTPIYKVGFTPAEIFVHKPESSEPELLRALSVRYVVSRRALAPPDFALERRFGALSVYRLEPFDGRRFELRGGGPAARVDVERFDDRGARLRVRGAAPGARLVLRVATYPRWEARVDGVVAPIAAAPLPDGRDPTFIEVAAPRDGVVELAYVARGADLAGGAITALALGALLALTATALRPDLAAAAARRLAPLGRGAERLAPVAAAALALLVAAPLVARAARGAAAPPSSLRAYLPAATAEVLRPGAPPTPCRRDGRTLRCGPRPWQVVEERWLRIGAELRRCVWAHPLPGARLRLRLPAVALGRRLLLRRGLADAVAGRGAPVELALLVGAERLRAEVVAPARGFPTFVIDTARFSGRRRDLVLEVSADDDASRHFCVDGEVEE